MAMADNGAASGAVDYQQHLLMLQVCELACGLRRPELR